MDQFNSDLLFEHLKELNRQADQQRLAKIAQGGQKRVLPFTRVASTISTQFNAWQAQRTARREARAWAMAQQIAAQNPHLTLRDTAC